MQKQFAGPKLKQIRVSSRLNLSAFAARLGVSVSYLSQIENNRRPLSAKVILRLLEEFDLQPGMFEAGGEHRLIADLREACAAPAFGGESVPLSEIRQVAQSAPRFAREYLALQRAYWQVDEQLKLVDEAVKRSSAEGVALLSYDEVRDYFHYKDNYIHELDVEGEALASAIHLLDGDGIGGRLECRLRKMGISVVRASDPDLVWRFDRNAQALVLNLAQPHETQTFQMAYQIASIELRHVLDRVLSQAKLNSASAVDICRVALTNYAAGALIMPYGVFSAAARALRYDIEALGQQFGASLEQVGHRLSNLQRPGRRGVPIYFLRMDLAGNVTKRHSATKLHFARHGGTCPLWNVHEAFSAPDKFLVQVAEMPDGLRYLSVARAIVKRSGSFLEQTRRYVIGFGCEIEHANALVYGDAVNLQGRATPIGVSCRICSRAECAQRAFPPINQVISVPPSERSIVPFRIASNHANDA